MMKKRERDIDSSKGVIIEDDKRNKTNITASAFDRGDEESLTGAKRMKVDSNTLKQQDTMKPNTITENVANFTSDSTNLASNQNTIRSENAMQISDGHGSSQHASASLPTTFSADQKVRELFAEGPLLLEIDKELISLFFHENGMYVYMMSYY
jgi:hypothetical protein